MLFRDRIRDSLKPEVTNLRNKFISTYGDPGKFKDRVERIHDQTLDIRDKVTTVKELHAEIQLHLSEIAGLSGSIQDDFPEFKDVLKNYNVWIEKAKLEWRIAVPVFELEIALAIRTLAQTAVTACTLATAGLGALVALGFAVVDIVSSVT